MEEVIAEILALIPAQYAVYVTVVCAVCALASAYWKAPAEDANPVVKFLYKLVNVLGLNVHHAKNADDEKKQLVIGK